METNVNMHMVNMNFEKSQRLLNHQHIKQYFAINIGTKEVVHMEKNVDLYMKKQLDLIKIN